MKTIRYYLKSGKYMGWNKLSDEHINNDVKTWVGSGHCVKIDNKTKLRKQILQARLQTRRIKRTIERIKSNPKLRESS